MTQSSKKRSPRSPYRDKIFSALRVVPTKRLAAFLFAGAPLTAAAYAASPDLGALVFWAWNGTLAVLSAAELALLPGPGRLTADREAPDRVDLGRPVNVRLAIRVAGGRQPLSGQAIDGLPDTFAGPDEWPALRFRGRAAEAAYETRPTERGRYVLHTVFVRYGGALGLWRRQTHIPCTHEIRVLPDLSGVRGTLASMQRSLILDGKRVFKKARSGTDFQSIREYTPDDDPRAINWSATARTMQPKVNVFQPERGKIVTLLIDSGRMMGTELDGKTKLDRTLEAALTLAAVALQRGDQVAALAFSGGLKAYVPPAKGMEHVQTIIDALYDLKSDMSESNYGLALTHLARVQKKRSFMVLFSDMESYLFEGELAPYLLRLRRTHLLLLLSLEDPLLHEWAGIAVRGGKDAYIKSTAHKLQEDRRRYAARMSALGIEVLDVPSDELALAAVNTYLDLKSRDAL
ncbi:DUF58 domain-containing protein [Paenibacillus alkalitolerans]|uniref:DUF58 domain-containing protein n=1 Tax=Paenibacillus alkalitolerans TaxID=2799335 RepID=UPI0018F6C15B|nr:DUF58 domain-containing protein [Paenibacillus alkalitolerans]